MFAFHIGVKFCRQLYLRGKMQLASQVFGDFRVFVRNSLAQSLEMAIYRLCKMKTRGAVALRFFSAEGV